LQRALSLPWFFVMQAIRRCSSPIELRQNRMASTLQADTTADRCAGLMAKLAVENKLAAMATAVATPIWRGVGRVRYMLKTHSFSPILELATLKTTPLPRSQHPNP
jgi:hypothetical protein